MKIYKVESPIGNNILSSDKLDEDKLRDLCLQLVAEPDTQSAWEEKVKKDPIESVISWLTSAGYDIKEINE